MLKQQILLVKHQTDQDKQQATESKNAKSSVDEEETSAVTTAEDGEENLNGVSEAELAAELYKEILSNISLCRKE